MSRYIRIDDLEQYSLSQVINGIINIQKLKTADVVEVVRCKDCKWQDKGENECESWNMCKHNVIEHFAIYDEHFCKWGERREDDGIH